MAYTETYEETSMHESAARTGRQRQRYENGYRLVAGCIPFKYKNDQKIKVLMINPQSGRGLLFPKGGWENDETAEEAAAREATEEAGVKGDLKIFLGHYEFKSKKHKDELSPEGLCRASMFALHVKEELNSWPEQNIRNRKWLSIKKAINNCRHPWMKEALLEFSNNYQA